MHRRPACTLSIPVAASTRGNTRTDLRAFPPLSGPPQFLLPATPQQPYPIIPGRSPAFGPVSQPHGYSTSPHQRESASTRRALPTRHMAAFVGPAFPLLSLERRRAIPGIHDFKCCRLKNRFIIPVLDPSPHRSAVGDLMQRTNSLHIGVLLAFAILTMGAMASSRANLAVVSRADLCVTEGGIDELSGNRLSVTVPKMRAYLNASTPQVVEAHFTYLGSTGNEARLGSGELRRQFGLKLRAQDACNLVYAMWRIEPQSELVVSVKTNPGQHTSAECGNRGYRNIKPSRSKPVPLLREGDTHDLRAEMNADEIKVFADNVLVWEGSVGSEALAFDGPVGIRSDNARLQLQLRAPHPTDAQRGQGSACRSGPGESE